MGSPFDVLESALMSTIGMIFGDDGTWTPTAGGPAITDKVLFKDASRRQELQDNKYEGVYPTMEYHAGKFPGLKEIVDDGNKTNEKMAINGRMYGVLSYRKKYDGDTHIAYLKPL